MTDIKPIDSTATMPFFVAVVNGRSITVIELIEKAVTLEAQNRQLRDTLTMIGNAVGSRNKRYTTADIEAIRDKARAAAAEPTP